MNPTSSGGRVDLREITMKILFYLCLILTITIPISAQLSTTAGKTYFNFLKLNPYPVDAALGKMAVALDNDPSPFLFNPSLLAGLEKSMILSGYYHLVEGINQGILSYAFPWKKQLPLAITAQYLNYGTIEGRDESGQVTGNLYASDFAVTTSMAYQYSQSWQFGASLNLAYSNLDGSSAAGISLSLGALYHTQNKGNFGISMLHLGVPLKKYNSNDQADYPTTLAIGWSKVLKHLPVVTSVTISQANGSDPYLHSGIIIRFIPAFNGRIGYYASLKEKIAFSNDDINRHGFTFGFDLNYQKTQLAFAFIPFGKLGTTQQLSLAYRF